MVGVTELRVRVSEQASNAEKQISPPRAKGPPDSNSLQDPKAQDGKEKTCVMFYI